MAPAATLTDDQMAELLRRGGASPGEQPSPPGQSKKAPPPQTLTDDEMQALLARGQQQPAAKTSKSKAPATVPEGLVSFEHAGKSVTLHPDIANPFQQAAADFKAETGKDIIVRSGYRTNAEQQALYKNRKPGGMPVAKPGRSLHEKGMALDVWNWKEAAPYLAKYGLTNDIKGDPIHFRMKPGAKIPIDLTGMQGATDVSQVDAKGMVRDASPYIRPTLQGLGAGGGALLGGAAGSAVPVAGTAAGGVAGSALGYGIATQAADLIDEWTGAKQPETLPQRLLSGAEQVGEGAMLEMGGQVGGKALGKGVQLAGKAIKPFLGKLSGTGTAAVEEALKSGGELKGPNILKAQTDFDKAMRGEITGEEIVENAQEALNVIKADRSAKYQAHLASVQKVSPEGQALLKESEAEANRILSGVKTAEQIEQESVQAIIADAKASGEIYSNRGAVMEKIAEARQAAPQLAEQMKSQATEAANATRMKAEKEAFRIDIDPIRSKLSSLMKRYNVKVDAQGNLDMSRMAMGKRGRSDIEDIIEDIHNFGSQPGDDTLVGLDGLKRRIDDFYSESSKAREFVTSIRNEVKDTIVKAVPEYGTMMDDYAKSTKIIKDLEAGLTLKKQGMTGRVTADQTLRRLTSAMKDNFELRRDLVNTLGSQGAKDLAGQIGGYTMSKPWAHGLMGTGVAVGATGALTHYFNPSLWPILAASSPRIQGEFLRVFGKGLAETAGATGAVSRAAIYEALNEARKNTTKEDQEKE